MDEILVRTHGAELLALKPYGEERIDALRRLISLVRILEQDGTGSLHQVIRRLDDEDFLKSASGESGDTAANCVRIMTFFKAKGLEFPVVCLYDLSRKGNRSEHIFYNRDQGTLEFSMNENLCTSGFSAAKELSGKRHEYEEMRLLYVAMTRARDRLAVPLFWLSRRKPKPVSLQKYLEAWYPRDDVNRPLPPNERTCCVDTEVYDLNKLPKERLVMDLTSPFSDQEVKESNEKLEAWIQRRTDAANKMNRASRFGRASESSSAATARAFQIKKSDGAAFGGFVHEVLERISIPGGSNLNSLIDDKRLRQGVSEEQARQAGKMIRAMLSSPLFMDRIAASEKIFRELPYAVMLDDVLYEGRMDLVFMEQGSAVIVDFKTNHGEPAELIEKYRFQAAIYARAIEQILGKNIREVILYHLRSGTPVHLNRAGLKLD
jgi:ATP-dependent exoDNAse (exonuclease V) beta subunit